MSPLQGANLRSARNSSLFFLSILYLFLSHSLYAAPSNEFEPGDDWSLEDLAIEPGPGEEKNENWLSGFGKNLDLGGYLKNETAYRYNEPRSITKIRNIVDLNAGYSINSSSRIYFDGWAYHDLAYSLFDYETIVARFARDSDQPLVFVEDLLQEKDSSVLDVKELYLDYFTENSDIRIGKQYIVWGVLEGMRITDELNPQDFRELILPDLLDYRIPLWSFKLDHYRDEATYQFVLIPDIRFHKPAPPGSEWELLQEVPNTVEPDTFILRNTEFGFRVARDVFDADISLSYFYTWDDFPVIFRTSEIDSALDPVFFPTFTRINMYGATFTKQKGPAIIKGEFVYVPDKYFGLRNDVDQDNDGFLDSMGELQKKHIRWGLGVDFNYRGFDLSPAIAQWIILDYNDGLIQDRFDTSLTLFVRKPMPQISSVFQMLAIALVNVDELYVKPKMIFNVTDRFEIAGGFDLFYGRKTQLGVSIGAGGVASTNATEQSAQFFGNFNNNNRVFMEFKYTF